MKKYLKGLSAIVMTMLLVVSLTACGADASSVEGTWTLTQTEINGVKIDISEAAKTNEAAKMTMEFKGGKATVIAAGQTMEGTYALNGSTLTITIDNQPEQEVQFDGTNIIMEIPGMTGKCIFTR